MGSARPHRGIAAPLYLDYKLHRTRRIPPNLAARTTYELIKILMMWDWKPVRCGAAGGLLYLRPTTTVVAVICHHEDGTVAV